MNSLVQTARIAGLLFLIFMVTSIFAGFVRSKLVDLGDAAAEVRSASPLRIVASFLIIFQSSVASAYSATSPRGKFHPFWGCGQGKPAAERKACNKLLTDQMDPST